MRTENDLWCQLDFWLLVNDKSTRKRRRSQFFKALSYESILKSMLQTHTTHNSQLLQTARFTTTDAQGLKIKEEGSILGFERRRGPLFLGFIVFLSSALSPITSYLSPYITSCPILPAHAHVYNQLVSIKYLCSTPFPFPFLSNRINLIRTVLWRNEK